MKKETAIFVQARTGSTRLPNKILLPFYQGKSILEVLLENLLALKDKYRLVLCTSTESGDDVLEDYAAKYEILCFRGSENNVLKRFVDAAHKFGVQDIIRVCADNPLIETKWIEYLMDKYESREETDYCSFKDKNGTPVIKTHIGLFAEAVKVSALEKVLEQTSENLFLEHVTNFLYGHQKKFKVDLYPIPAPILDSGFLRFTIDDQNDFDNMSLLFDKHIAMGGDILKTVEYVISSKDHLNLMKINIQKYNK